MAKIIYKEGHEGQNTIESIEGIEIGLFNGQKALTYPKYTTKPLLESIKIDMWNAFEKTEIEALKEDDNLLATKLLWTFGSPAAKYVNNFYSDKYNNFGLPTLLAAMEIQDQKEDIDKLAELIDGADLLRNFDSYIWTCLRYNEKYGWVVFGNGGFALGNYLCNSHLIVPTILYR